MFITEEGGLTGAGYAIFIVAAVAILLIAAFILGRKENHRYSARKLTFCGMCLALAFVMSYIRLFKMPWGGSITLCSMFFVVLAAYWYGAGTGIAIGVVYGILQFLQDPYFLTILQVCFDYLFAYGALGLAGFFSKKKNGLVKGYIVAVIGRGVFASLAGYIYWMEYMPENFPKSLSAIYPIAYNFAYLTVEAIITLVILAIPAVKKALERVRKYALQDRYAMRETPD